MAESEGVIQYDLAYRPGALPAAFDPAPLFAAFRACRSRGLVGQSPARYGGYAYGNISQRVAPGFVISGTQTGGKPALGRQDLAWVTEVDPAANHVVATGPARPSSEAMSHGEVYRASADVGAVIHVHSPSLWRTAARLGLPVTPPSAGYGTPAMAHEVRRVLDAQPLAGVLAMGGHEDGIIAYATVMADALQLLLDRLKQAEGLA
jgi:ribulose-5-phosphate 4-epimerase/fuculose-1-phosphate aldolase